MGDYYLQIWYIFVCKLPSMVYGLFKPCWLTHPTHTSLKEIALLFNVHLSLKLTMKEITGWVKMSAAILVSDKKLKKNALKQSPNTDINININGPKCKWFKISYFELFFKKYYYRHATHSSTRSSWHYQSFFFLISDFLAESLKANKN